ncbi:MAG: SpoIIE family protein phosphatase [Spirochaetia bacterium]|jgi:serine phosphatase RsbU (regulator of sigma subunit)
MMKARFARSFLLAALSLCMTAVPGLAQVLYWDAPRVFIPKNIGSSSSAAGPSLMALAWQEILPRSQADQTSGDIYLSIAVSHDGTAWKTHPRYFGPVPYAGVTAGNEPRVYSMVIDAHDRILVAVASSDRETTILQSIDEGASFQQVRRLTAGASTVVPNLFTANGGGFLLLVSQGASGADASSGSATLAFSRSPEGRTWSDLSPFITEADRCGSPQLQPAHAAFQGRDLIVFESYTSRSDLVSITGTWQLYAKTSADGGVTWEAAVPITPQSPLFGADPLAFDNERPSVSVAGTQLALVWERSSYGSSKPQIWTAPLDGKASVAGTPEAVATDSPSRFAQVLPLKSLEYVLYADSSKGTSRIMLAQKGKTWSAQPQLNTDILNAVFPHGLVFNNSLFLFWENQPASGGTSSLVQLQPLTRVGAPVVKPVDFTPGQPANKDTVTVSWTEPEPPDPSGIKEYQYTWSYSNGATTVEVEKKPVSGLTTGGKPQFCTQKVDKDGTWTFSIVAVDLAGNITEAPATLSFIRDATPPAAVSFELIGQDGRQLLSAPAASPGKRDAQSHVVDTNTFTLRWLPAGDKDIVGYTYNLQPGWTSLDDYLQSTVPLLSPPHRNVTTTTDIAFQNKDNGVYVLTVQAIDRAGNFSQPSTIALGLGKYQVVTRVDFVTAQKDPLLGTVKLTIVGRGFTENGALQHIYLDRKHTSPPWDMVFDPVAPLTVTDRQITGIMLDQNRDSGSYRIGLLQKRATGQQVLYFTPGAMVDFVSPGTVKIGNFQILLPRWIAGPSPQYVFSFDSLVVVLIVALLCALSFLAIRKIFALAQEGAAVREEVMALLEGRPNEQWEERKKRMQALKRKGMGLRLKFTLLMVVLVTMIVLIVSIPLGFQMVNRQRTALAASLQNKAAILLGAMASSAETQFQLQDQGYDGATGIPDLRSPMPDAVSAAITGAHFEIGVPNQISGPTSPKDLVWASDIKRFADERTAGRFMMASETVDDELAKRIPDLQKKIDADLTAKLSSSLDQYRALKGQQKNLMTKTDAASKTQLGSVTAQLTSVRRDIDTQAKAVYAQSSTLENFKPNARLLPTYMFYEPVIFYNGADNLAETAFYQGMIRLEVKTDAINQQITQAINSILGTASAIALAAIALGILGAIIMASITVTPIRKLARGVAVIRDTEDKEHLKEHVIEVGTRDEIGQLAETVNEMTRGLVEAAVKNKLLLLGKDVQKRFLPLEKDTQNRIGTTASEETKAVEIYGYYEGAKEVSGDYFDFKKLDETHYAIIKCDVSGKGVPAALVMVEVATVFISYFRDWPKRKSNIAQIKEPKARQRALQELERLDTLVYTINDMLEERGFKGMFAALTVCIFNAETNMATVCNAGDTLMHIYEASDRKLIQKKLPDSPAAGVFPSTLVEMKSGFKQVPHRLDKGDALVLFTDGFEEAKRSFRNANGEIVACEAPEVKEDEPHLGTHTRGQTSEEFGLARISAIVTAVFTRERYRLVRHHLVDPTEELEFDFSSCLGTVKDAVLALVAVEKVFRLIPAADAGAGSKIVVESKVDAFLKDHFRQYEKYFSHRGEGQQNETTVTFTHLKEDEQYDDLTILVLRRK